MPNGLKLELEPTICNHDDDFLNNWYKNLQQYSLDFVKDVATFCDTTITCLASEIQNTENELQHILEKDIYQDIQNTTKTNQTTRDRSLKQRKLKKFNQTKVNSTTHFPGTTFARRTRTKYKANIICRCPTKKNK